MTAPDPGNVEIHSRAAAQAACVYAKLLVAGEDPGLIFDSTLWAYERVRSAPDIVWLEDLYKELEQHANGRMAELYEQRDNAIEAGIAAIDRAEKAEAKAAKLEAELEKYRAEERGELEWQRFCAQQDVRCTECGLRYGERKDYTCPHIGDHKYDADELRAAKEGES